MKRPNHHGLIALAAVLLATIVGELLTPPMADLDGTTVGRARPTPTATPAAPRLMWSVDALLARPLFRPDRKPKAGSTVRTLDIPGLAELRLAGIVDASNLKRAVFQPIANGKTIIVGTGDRLGDWIVTAIDAISVTITRGGDVRRLQPHFAAPSTVAQPPPAGPMPTPDRPTNAEILGLIGAVRIPPRPLISDRP